MEGQFATQALLVDQQRRIKQLEAELASTQLEVLRLRSQVHHHPAAHHPHSHIHHPVPPLPPAPLSVTEHPPAPHLRPPAPPPASASASTTNPPAPQEETKKASSRYWTAEEHARFLEGLQLFGQKDIKAISRHVGTRSATQVRTHAQKYYLRIERERAKAELDGNGRPSVPGSSPASSSEVLRPTTSAFSGPGQSAAKPAPNADGSDTAGSRPGGIDGKAVHSGASASTSASRPAARDSNTCTTPSRHVPPNGRSPASASVPVPIANGTVTTQTDATPSHTAIAHTKGRPSLIPPVSSTDSQSAPIASAVPPYPGRFRSPTASTPSLASAPALAPGTSARAPAMSKLEPVVQGTAVSPRSRATAKTEPACIADAKPLEPTPSQQLPPLKGHGLPPPAPTLESQPNTLSSQRLSKEEAQIAGEKGKELGKRTAQQLSKKSPKKRLKKPAGLVPLPTGASSSAPLPPPTTLGHSGLPRPAAPSELNGPLAKSGDHKMYGHGDGGGSLSNFRALLRVPTDDQVPGASGSKPPTLRRNESSNSVLADLSKNVGVLSRSNSFISPNGKGVTRSSSILSLLSGIPTALRESPSTDRLMMLDGGEDRVMATLKSMDGVGNNVPATSGAGPSTQGPIPLGAMGDRSFSFGQLQHIGLDDLEDPSAVALSLSEQKWGDG